GPRREKAAPARAALRGAPNESSARDVGLPAGGGDRVTYEQAVRVIEGKLYAYYLTRLDYPDAAVSGAYEEWIPPSGQRESVQERWVSRHSQALADAAIIEQVLRRLTPRDRTLVRMRYGERWTWDAIGRRLGLSGKTLDVAKHRVWGIFYGAFRLWA